MAEKKFIDVNDAYSALSDPKKKRMQDRRVDPLNPEEASSGGMHFGRDVSETIKMFFLEKDSDEIFRNPNEMTMKKIKYVKAQLWCELT